MEYFFSVIRARALWRRMGLPIASGRECYEYLVKRCCKP